MGRDKLCRGIAKVEAPYRFAVCPEQPAGVLQLSWGWKLLHQQFPCGGRKNWLFAGSPKGAAASAGIYTLVETAKANGLDAMKYIKYILADMPGSRFLENPEYLDDYLPWDPMVQERCR